VSALIKWNLIFVLDGIRIIMKLRIMADRRALKIKVKFETWAYNLCHIQKELAFFRGNLAGNSVLDTTGLEPETICIDWWSLIPRLPVPLSVLDSVQSNQM
jgi:hypothetical protein